MPASARLATITAVMTAVALAAWWASRPAAGPGHDAAPVADAAVEAPPAAPSPAVPRARSEPDSPPAADEAAPEPAPKRAPLTIRVLSEADGAAVASATVRVEVWDEGDEQHEPVKRTVEATTDRAGTAVVTAWANVDGPDVFVSAPGFVRCDWERTPYGAKPGDDFVTVRLAPGVVAEGTVVDAKTGAPVAGAHLVAAHGGEEQMHCFGRGPESFADVVTAADGRFRLDALPRGETVSISVTAPRHVAQAFDWTWPQSRRFDVRLEPAGRVHGVVRDGIGAPVESVRVVARRARDREDLDGSMSTTAADGAYELDCLPLDEELDVWALEQWFNPTRASVPERVPRLTAEAPEAQCDLTLLAPAKLVVRVRDGDRKPPAGAVWFRSDSIESATNLVEPSDPEFVVAQPGRCRISVVSPTLAPWTKELDVEPGATQTVDVAMSRGLSIAGVVVDEKGAPIAGAKVSAERPDEAPWFKYRVEQEATSAADGAFELTGCADGGYTVKASADGRAYVEIEDVHAPANGLRVVLAARQTGSLTFRIRPAPSSTKEVWVRAVFSSGGATSDDTAHWYPSEPDAPLEFSQTPGAYDVVLILPGFAPAKRHVVIADGETTDLGEVAFDQGVAIHGRVVDPDGSPVAGARVQAFVGAARVGQAAWTDASGAFHVLRVAPGEVTLAVAAEGFDEAMLACKASADTPPVVVTLDRAK